jgi:putative nucleotidyltransferase with HDIG domain
MDIKDITNNEINYFLKNGKPIIYKDYKVSKESEDFYVNVLNKILKLLGKEKVADHLGYCLRELVINAKKANTKRVYFLNENLDIYNAEHYEIGMKEFKKKVFDNVDFYLDLQEKYDLYVQIYFHVKDPFLNIIVSNNSPLVSQEKQRITQKLARAKIFGSVDEAVQSVLDDTEGAGLGIVLLILILRKIGINDKNFAVAVENNVTHLRIAVPLSLVTEEEADIISEALVKEINSIPQFPEHILQLTEMLKDIDVNMAAVANIIRRDPGLTMGILKMANSAHYRRLNKIERIDLAVNIIGVNGLKYLIQSFGAKKVLEQKYSNGDIEKLWSHSLTIAQISSILCNKYSLNDLGDYIYIGGLLHDIGKILIRGLHSKTIDKISKLCIEKGISLRVIEDLMDGSNHAKIGSKMASKWNLPEKVSNIIKFHHNPFASSDDIREIVKIIYLADIINSKIDNPEKQIDYDDIVLNQMKINNEKEFLDLLEYVKIELGKRI